MIQYRSYKTHLKDTRTIERVGYLTSLVTDYANKILETYWNPESLSSITNLVKTPSQKFMVYRRLKWSVTTNAYLPDRVKRLGEAQAMMILVDQARLEQAYQAMRENEPVPKYTKTHDIKRLRKLIQRNPDATSITELYRKPVIRNIKLDAGLVDKQFYELVSSNERTITLSLKLPKIAIPEKRSDWERVTLAQTLPKIASTEHVRVGAPIITQKNITIPLEYEVPDQAPELTTRAIGVDWGITTIATISHGEYKHGELLVDPTSYSVIADKYTSKLAQLNLHSDTLQRKITRLNKLIKGGSQELVPLMHTLVRERELVNKKRVNLNQSLAWLVAQRIVQVAIQTQSTTIYVENLATLTAGGLGADLNRKISQANRSQLQVAIRHSAAKQGISVVMVNPHHTSQSCHCGARVTHPEWKISKCANCGLTANRDALASGLILSRGIATRESLKRNKAGSHYSMDRVFVPVKQTRLKSFVRTGATHAYRLKVPIIAISLRHSEPSSKDSSERYSRSHNNHDPLPLDHDTCHGIARLL